MRFSTASLSLALGLLSVAQASPIVVRQQNGPFPCPSVDDAGNALINEVQDASAQEPTTCTYPNARCGYSLSGSAGASTSSNCPNSINPKFNTGKGNNNNNNNYNGNNGNDGNNNKGNNGNDNNNDNDNAVGQANVSCFSVNLDGSQLAKETPSDELQGGVVCRYADKSTCVYFGSTAFSSGGDSCPCNAVDPAKGQSPSDSPLEGCSRGGSN